MGGCRQVPAFSAVGHEIFTRLQVQLSRMVTALGTRSSLVLDTHSDINLAIHDAYIRAAHLENEMLGGTGTALRDLDLAAYVPPPPFLLRGKQQASV